MARAFNKVVPVVVHSFFDGQAPNTPQIRISRQTLRQRERNTTCPGKLQAQIIMQPGPRVIVLMYDEVVAVLMLIALV